MVQSGGASFEALFNNTSPPTGAPSQAASIVQAAPAPRFSRTEPELPEPPVAPGEHSEEVLASIGLDAAAIAELKSSGAVV